MNRTAAEPEISQLVDWLRNEAEEKMTHVLSRRDGAKAMKGLTASQLRDAKKSAEKMFGRKLDLVKTDVKSNEYNVAIQERIADKYEIEARKLSNWADIIERSCGQDANLQMCGICHQPILCCPHVPDPEAAHLQTIDERDHFEDVITNCAIAAGCTEEWSSTHEHGDCIINELHRLRSCGETAWVSVDERLPEEDVRVLVWNKAVKDWEIATRDRGRFIDDTGTQTDLTNVVTYWAALPRRQPDARRRNNS